MSTIRIKFIREPRNEELIKKVVQAQDNYETLVALWEKEKYSQAEILDSLFYASEDGLITMKLCESNLAEWLEQELYDWLPEYLDDFVNEQSKS